MGKDGQGQKGTFWNNANVLYLVLGGGYKSVHNCQNSSNEQFRSMLIKVNYTSIELPYNTPHTHTHTRPDDSAPALIKFAAGLKAKGKVPFGLLEKLNYMYKVIVASSSFRQRGAWCTNLPSEASKPCVVDEAFNAQRASWASLPHCIRWLTERELAGGSFGRGALSY